MVAMMVPIVRGNVVRAIITSTVVMVPTLYIMNGMASIHSEVARMSNFEFPAGSSVITSLCDGGNWVAYIFTLAANNFWIGNAVIVVILAVLWTLYKKNSRAWERLAGYSEEA